MSLVKDRLMEDQQRQQRAKDEMPEKLDDAITKINELTSDQEISRNIIEELETNISKSNSFKAKIKDHLISGVIGSIIGFVLGYVFSFIFTI